MTDTRLRELERRWQQSGTDDAHADLLIARVRAGDLAQDRLELAAYLAHPGARTAILKAPSGPFSTNGDVLMLGSAEWMCVAETLKELRSFTGKLHKWGAEAAYRGLLAMVHVAVRTTEANGLRARGVELAAIHPDGSEEAVPMSAITYRGRRRICERHGVAPSFAREILDAAELWLVDPGPMVEGRVHHLTRADARAWSNALGAALGPYERGDLAALTTILTSATGSFLNDYFPRPLPGPGYFDVTKTDYPEVREEIRRELCPWALGEGDPVRERVEEAQAAVRG